jgi:ATP-binding protein involved in chromosome partitioning
MKIAIPLTGGRLADHFGHCDEFALIEMDPASKEILVKSLVVPPPHEPGVLPRWLHQEGVQVILAGGMGRRALGLFAQHGIAVHAGAAGGTPEELAQAYANGALAGGTPSCGHDHHQCYERGHPRRQ